MTFGRAEGAGTARCVALKFIKKKIKKKSAQDISSDNGTKR